MKRIVLHEKPTDWTRLATENYEMVLVRCHRDAVFISGLANFVQNSKSIISFNLFGIEQGDYTEVIDAVAHNRSIRRFRLNSSCGWKKHIAKKWVDAVRTNTFITMFEITCITQCLLPLFVELIQTKPSLTTLFLDGFEEPLDVKDLVHTIVQTNTLNMLQLRGIWVPGIQLVPLLKCSIRALHISLIVGGQKRFAHALAKTSLVDLKIGKGYSKEINYALERNLRINIYPNFTVLAYQRKLSSFFCGTLARFDGDHAIGIRVLEFLIGAVKPKT